MTFPDGPWGKSPNEISSSNHLSQEEYIQHTLDFLTSQLEKFANENQVTCSFERAEAAHGRLAIRLGSVTKGLEQYAERLASEANDAFERRHEPYVVDVTFIPKDSIIVILVMKNTGR